MLQTLGVILGVLYLFAFVYLLLLVGRLAESVKKLADKLGS